MIINLRGTNGSGKSTIVREVMKRFTMFPQRIAGRRQPIGYCSQKDGGPALWVVGHYETECGGSDTISSLDVVYEEVSQAADQGFNVLYEGIMASGEYRRCVKLSKQYQVFVLALDTPLDQCVAAINDRRTRRGQAPLSDTDRTRRRAREVRSMMEYLKTNSVRTKWVSRDDALQTILSELGVTR